MNNVLKFGALALVLVAQPVLAVTPPKPTVFYTPGSFVMPTWTSAKIFQDFQSASLNHPYSAGTNEVVKGSVDVDNGLAFGGSSANANKFLAITDDGSYRVNFTTSAQFFSFSLDDLESTDVVTLSFANGTSLKLAGLDIVGSTNKNLYGSDGRVVFDMTGQSGITSVLFTSLSDCTPFLIDNLASAAPEPGTWAMMILGFGLAGAALRRRRTTARVTFA